MAPPSEVRLILASGSATRQQMLTEAGVPLSVVVPTVDEEIVRQRCHDEGVATEAAALALAEAKARAVAEQYPEQLVLGADQLLELGSEWLGKPVCRASAARQLAQLSGATHRLVSGAVLLRGSAVVWRGWDQAALTMRRLTPEAIERYLDQAGPAVLSSVGCYQIERLGVRLFDRIQGDWFAILGLPLLSLLPVLRQQEVID